MCTKNDLVRRSIQNFIDTNHPGVCGVTLQFSSEPDDEYHGIPTLIADFFRDAEKRGYGLRFCDNYLFIIGDFKIEISEEFNINLDEILASLSEQDKADVPSVVLLDACPNNPKLDDRLIATLDHAVSGGYPKNHIHLFLNVLRVSLEGCGDSDCEICA